VKWPDEYDEVLDISAGDNEQSTIFYHLHLEG